MVDIDPEILKVFGFWGSILVLKLMVMAPLTVRQRYRKQIFSNPNDVALFKSTMPKAKVQFDDPDVERIRRSHLNDLENVVPWFIITYIWLTTGPSVILAKVLIRTFVLSRIIHTLAYAVMPQQPTRAISFFVGFGITGYKALTSLLYYL